MMSGYYKTQANDRAQREITLMVQEAARTGTSLHSEEVARKLNQNRSRCFSINRVGCLLRARNDVELARTGVWQPVIAKGVPA